MCQQGAREDVRQSSRSRNVVIASCTLSLLKKRRRRAFRTANSKLYLKTTRRNKSHLSFSSSVLASNISLSSLHAWIFFLRVARSFLQPRRSRLVEESQLKLAGGDSNAPFFRANRSEFTRLDRTSDRARADGPSIKFPHLRAAGTGKGSTGRVPGKEKQVPFLANLLVYRKR